MQGFHRTGSPASSPRPRPVCRLFAAVAALEMQVRGCGVCDRRDFEGPPERNRPRLRKRGRRWIVEWLERLVHFVRADIGKG